MTDRSSPSSGKPLGLIAGEGIFPILVAQGARAAGRKIICIGLAGSARPEVADQCDQFHWVGVLRLGQWIRTLRKAGVQEAIMVGRVQKTRMYGRWHWFQTLPDFRTLRLWFTRLRYDKRPQAMLQAIAQTLSSEGIELMDSTTYVREQVTSVGVLSRRTPTTAQWVDIKAGWEICRSISRMDIGQAIAIRERDIIAVEALEGTNAMIERAGNLCKKGGWTFVKVANARQDMRMDVPTVGTTTLEKLHAAGATCIVLEAGKTILLEREKVLEMAESFKMTIVGLDDNGLAGGAEKQVVI